MLHRKGGAIVKLPTQYSSANLVAYIARFNEGLSDDQRAIDAITMLEDHECSIVYDIRWSKKRDPACSSCCPRLGTPST